MTVTTEVAVESLDVAAYTIPTDEPESDGTLEWDSTTIVLVEAHAGDATGLGYTYTDAAAAKLIGLDGVRIESPEEIDGAWERAFAADRPFVIDARTDPNVPPLPPHITIEQARAMASALMQGDASRREMVTQAAKGKLQEFLPGR